ncbi:MAG: CoA transferase, partial [Chloroflexi bacterium]|nr:CoA transferase [Chloroflexota bacterium]
PQVSEREMIVEVEHPVVGRYPVPGVPIKLSATPGSVRAPAPLVGEHNDEVYGEILGRSPAELAFLREAGII